MKAIQISIFENTRSWNAGLFAWDGSKIITLESPSTIESGPLSQCGNRTCTHLKMNATKVSPIATNGLNLVPYNNASFPALHYNSVYGRLSTVGTGSPLSYWEYKSNGVLYTEETSIHASNESIFVFRKWDRYLGDKLIYRWEGVRQYYIIDNASSIKYHEDYTEFNNNPVIYHGTNDGRVNVQWRIVDQFVLSGLLDPKFMFRSELWSSAIHEAYSLPLKTPGQLSSDCMDKFFGPVNNGIQYIAEMTHLRGLAKPLVSLMQGDVSLKALSSAYLSYEYGARLAAKDTYSYLSKMRRDRGIPSKRDYSRLYARDVAVSKLAMGEDVKITRNLAIYYVNASNFLVKSANALRSFGFMPSAEIAWDFIPFSFIVDWFAPIGEALNSFDKQGVYDSYTWLEHCYSNKIELTIDLLDHPYFSGIGTLVVTGYYRQVDSNAPRPSMRFDDLNLSSRQLRNGAAILFQNW